MADSEQPASVILHVKVIPRASKSEVVGVHGEVLRVRLTSPPVDGAANQELIKLLAKTFHIARSDVEIVRA